MKNALILHGTKASPELNWFGWLKAHLQNNGYENVWVPQLPGAEQPEMSRYREFIFNSDFVFSSATLMVGHSSGAVAALSLLEAMPEDIAIDTAIMVGVYRPEEKHYSSTEELNISKIKNKARRFVFLHSDNDPYCPLEHAEYYADVLGGELVVSPDQDHFSNFVSPVHSTIPEITKILELESEK